MADWQLTKRPPTLHEARQFIFDLIRLGGSFDLEIAIGSISPAILTCSDQELELYFKNLGQWESAVTSFRENPDKLVPILEYVSLLDCTYVTVDQPTHLQVSMTREIGGVSLPSVGLGKLSRLDYLMQFKSACKARDNTVHDCDVDELFNMINRGFASIESFLNLRAYVHDKKSSETSDKLLSIRKTSTRDKIKIWLPKMTGVALDTSTSEWWQEFIRLEAIRDDSATHPKIQNNIKSREEISIALNGFKKSIAHLMLKMHMAFNVKPIDPAIIRAFHYPTVCC